MTSELKPCPFPQCGSTRVRLFMRADTYYQVSCDECGARGPVRQSGEEAVTAWNARAEEQARQCECGRTDIVARINEAICAGCVEDMKKPAKETLDELHAEKPDDK